MTPEAHGLAIQKILEHMGREAGKASSGMVRPLDSSSLIILDRSTRAPKVLMGRRNPNQRFMPGVFVFPGGAIEASDRKMNVVGALSGRAEDALNKQVSRPSPLRGRALALAAIRETYEETGLILGTRAYGAPDAPDEPTWKKFAAAEIYPDIEQLSFIARAITPPGKPKRFDTRFFVVDHKQIIERHDGFIGPDKELTELTWVPLKDTQKFDMPLITRTILNELRIRLEAGLSELMPVPFFTVKRGRAVRELL